MGQSTVVPEPQPGWKAETRSMDLGRDRSMMHLQFTPYTVPLVLSGAVTAVLAGYAWRHRRAPGAIAFFVLTAALTLWPLADALEVASLDLQGKLVWANLQYLSYVTVPVAWLILTLQYTGREQWTAHRRLVCLAIVPVITVALVWTNEYHGLIRRDVFLDPAGEFSVIHKVYGPWFWVHTAYSYLLFLWSGAMLWLAARRAPAMHRRQPLALLAGMALPLVGNVVYVLGLSPVRWYDVTPVFVGLAGAIAGWGLFKYRLFDVLLIARDTVLEGLSDGIVVLDARDRVVDLNRSAEKMLGYPAAKAFGRDAALAISAWPEVLDLCRKGGAGQIEFTMDDGEGSQHYEAHVSTLLDRHGSTAGRVILLRDITERRRTENALRESERRYRELAEMLPETVFECDPAGRLTFGNHAGLEQFGFTQEEFAAGLNVIELVAPVDRARAIDRMQHMLQGGATEPAEYTAVKKDGSTFPVVICTARILRDDRPVGLRGFVVDMTERKRAEAQWIEREQALARVEADLRVASAEERLRREIAELLHGRVQTQLLVAWFRLGECLNLLGSDPAAAGALLDEVRAEIDHIREHEVRQASHVLHPTIIGVGLAPAVQSLADRFREHFEIGIDLDPRLAQIDSVVDNRIPEPLRLAAYRVIEEALNNVLRHSEARKATITLRLDGDEQLSVSVCDDGRGFDSSTWKMGLGLGSVAGRVEQIGGKWEVASEVGHGTTLSAVIPLGPRATALVSGQ